jgi:hypothetical protein
MSPEPGGDHILLSDAGPVIMSQPYPQKGRMNRYIPQGRILRGGTPQAVKWKAAVRIQVATSLRLITSPMFLWNLSSKGGQTVEPTTIIRLVQKFV